MSAPTGETLYQFRSATKVVLQRARANVTSLAAYRDGALVAPSSGTYTLTDPDGTEVDSGAVVITDDIATYTIAAADLPTTLEAGGGYLEVWDLTIGGVDYQPQRLVALGLTRLFPPVTADDLVEGEYPDLEVNLGANGAAVLQTFMDSTWNACIRYLERRGTWADIVVDAGELFDWYRHETLRRAFSSMLQRQPTDRWRELLADHRDQAKEAKAALALSLDRNRDGKADGGKEAVARSIHRNVPPRRSRRRSARW